MWFVMRSPQEGERGSGQWQILHPTFFNTEEAAVDFLKDRGEPNGPEYVIACAEKAITLGVHFVDKAGV